jgi:hypothetical protein
LNNPGQVDAAGNLYSQTLAARASSNPLVPVWRG